MSQLKGITVFLLSSIIVANGCEVGWFPYNKDKCVFAFDTISTFNQSVEYCETALQADILTISNVDEKDFWTYYLFRYLNVKANVWIQPLDNGLISDLNVINDGTIEKTNQCFTLRSVEGVENNQSKVGDIIVAKCDALGSTVCEISNKPQQKKQTQQRKNDPNSEFFPNKRVKLLDGNETQIFTGLYYRIYSKYEKKLFTNHLLANGHCSLENVYEFGDCESYIRDLNNTDKDMSIENTYMLSYDKSHDNNSFRMRKFSSTKQIVSHKKRGLNTAECFKDGSVGKLCDTTLKLYKLDPFWKLESNQPDDFYKIKSSDQSSMIGLSNFRNNTIDSTAFGLYNDREITNNSNDKLFFRFELENYTFNAQLYSVEFDKSLDELISSNKKQISLIDTAIINNNSPASLNHEVSSEKQITESFTTSFESSTKFMESFALKEELSGSDTQTATSTKSFTKSASEAVSSSLSQSLSTSNSNSASSSSGLSGGGNLGFGGFGVSGSYNKGSSSTSSTSVSQDRSENYGTTSSKDNSKTNSKESSLSSTKTKTSSEDKTEGKEQMIHESKAQTSTKQHTYRISKIVSVQPYSAVKISSYANWVNDLTVPFKLNIKFTAHSWRRKTDGKATNEWRTVDADVVEYLMKVHDFPGRILRKEYDTVFGQITGSMTASVGMESVFSSQEINLKEK